MGYEEEKERREQRERQDRASMALRPPIGGIAVSQSNAPVGTTTATSIGRDPSLSGPGSRRKLGNPTAQRAERLAKRYLRKYGAAGKLAASHLLGNAATSRMGDASIETQVGQAARAQFEREQEEERWRQSMLNPDFDPFNP